MDRSRNFAPTIDNAALATHFTVFGFTFLLLGKKKKINVKTIMTDSTTMPLKLGKPHVSCRYNHICLNNHLLIRYCISQRQEKGPSVDSPLVLPSKAPALSPLKELVGESAR